MLGQINSLDTTSFFYRIFKFLFQQLIIAEECFLISTHNDMIILIMSSSSFDDFMPY